MQKLNRRSLLLVGFTLFSMFFGAGNLIFPPYLGAQAGTVAWLAFVGFAVSAIGLPVIGVIAVARAGGLSELAGRVHPRFAQVFALLVYLSIGPCLAIPRTASTSFQMLAPLIGGDAMRQLIYSIVFFAAAFFVALHPEKLTSWLGRILCPTLIVLIFVLFFGCLFHPVAEHYGVPTAAYASLPGLTGILNGYQTMDTLAALNFGAVIALNIRDYGIEDEQQVRRSTIRAGWIAGAMLLLVYAMLTHVGALSGAAWPGGSTGADTLSNIARGLFGPVGQVLLAAIFVIACFNTCVGLIACVGQYFHAAAYSVSGHCGVFCCGQHDYFEYRSGGYYPSVHAGAERDLSGRYRADRAVVSPEAGETRCGLPPLHCLYCGAEHCRGIPDSGLVAAAAGTAAERTRLRLADAGCGRSADWLAASEEN